MTEHEQDAAEAPTAEAPAPPADHGAAGFVTGLLIGTLLGAGVALLFAPVRGDRLRRQLGRGARALRERARDELEDAARRARREIARHRP